MENKKLQSYYIQKDGRTQSNKLIQYTPDGRHEREQTHRIHKAAMETNQSNSLKWLDSWSVMSTVNE
jgi:hypothetical protein